MASPAIQTDLQNRSLRTLTSQELSVGATLLGDAWSILTTRLPTLEARVADNTNLRSVAIQVQCAMVLRLLNNPDGKLSETIDDYTYRLDAAVSTGALYVSDAEVALLADTATSGGAFSIKPSNPGVGPGYWADTTTWVAL
jgi:hypothetical protein